jgi:4-alpha-glucanotransferase
MIDKRSSGILMHITSLPSPYGIGTVGTEALRFIDFLCEAGQTYWQILPLGSTGYGDSPYQSFSAFDGNPYLIDLDMLIDQNLLDKKELEGIDFGSDPGRVDFGKVIANKLKVLHRAFDRVDAELTKRIGDFREQNAEWIEEYVLFMSLKHQQGMDSWLDWPDDFKFRHPDALSAYRKQQERDLAFWVFTQYLFFSQWERVKSYAHEKGITIIGDMPLYIASDSVDVWANSDLFLLDDQKKPTVLSGCPPDAFTDEGQFWGNPIYRWEKHDEQNFSWWIARLRANLKLYDIIRLDHFRGLESYWEIPGGSTNAVHGRWVKGPGKKIFDVIRETFGDAPFIAEDLGFLTEEVHELRRYTGYPGMKVLQFAFDTREESDYLPHNFDKNCVVYTGTHDNDTVMGWLTTSGKPGDVKKARDYLKLNREEGEAWGYIRGAWSSTGMTAIAQMQDFLALGSSARMNIPSTIGGNWTWRMKQDDITPDLVKKIRHITQLYGRTR